MRLGDLDYAQKQLTIAEVECGKNFQTDCNHVRDFLNALPTIDAVPVVRCKDCKCGKVPDMTIQADKYRLCGLYSSLPVMPVMRLDDFCSYGERKDG